MFSLREYSISSIPSSVSSDAEAQLVDALARRRQRRRSLQRKTRALASETAQWLTSDRRHIDLVRKKYQEKLEAYRIAMDEYRKKRYREDEAVSRVSSRSRSERSEQENTFMDALKRYEDWSTRVQDARNEILDLIKLSSSGEAPECKNLTTKNILETYLRFMNRKRRVSEKNSADVRLRDILVSTSRPQFLKNFSHPTPILSTRDFMDSSSLPHLSLSSIDASSISSEELASPSSAFRRVKENPTYLSSLSSILERSVENIFSHVSSTDFDKLSSLLRSGALAVFVKQYESLSALEPT